MNLHLGTVINNSDLSQDGNTRPNGQVKVLIHGMSITSPEGERYKFPMGGNLRDTVTNTTKELVEDQEVWCYVMHPIAGGGGSMAKFNAATNKAVISDSDYPTQEEGPPPADNYGMMIDDGFAANEVGTAGVNPNAYSYAPDNRSNCPKGMFSMPDVGDRVIVAFINGSRGMPIVLGVLYGYDAFSSMFGTDADDVYPNYPLAFSNIQQ